MGSDLLKIKGFRGKPQFSKSTREPCTRSDFSKIQRFRVAQSTPEHPRAVQSALDCPQQPRVAQSSPEQPKAPQREPREPRALQNEPGHTRARSIC